MKKSFVEALIEKKVLVIIVCILVMMGGIGSYITIPKQNFPEVVLPVASVTAIYPGASAEDMEQLVAKPIEDVVMSLDGFDSCTTQTFDNACAIMVSLSMDFDQEAVDDSFDDLRLKLEALKPSLPSGVTQISVDTNIMDTAGLLLSVSGTDVSGDELSQRARELKDALKLMDGVKRVDLVGEQLSEIAIVADPVKLNSMDISLAELSQIIAAQNTLVPTGTITTDGSTIPVHSDGTFESIGDISNLVIGGNQETGILYRLSDVADVQLRAPEDAPRYYFNGTPSVVVALYFENDINVVSMADGIRETVNKFSSTLPDNISVDELYFQSDVVRSAVNGFMVNLIEAILLVLLVVMVGMGPRNGLIVSIAIPLSICACFLMMPLLGMQIQFVSLAALIVVLGMLVDNSVVVSDAIQARLNQGESQLDAAVHGTKDVAVSVFVSMLTTVAGFAALLTLSGTYRQLALSLPVVIITCLIISFIVAMCVTPLMSYFFLRPADSGGHDHLKKLIDLYDRFSVQAFTNRKKTLCGVFAFMALCACVLPFIGMEVVGKANKDVVTIQLTGNYDNGMEHTQDTVRQIEEILAQQPEVRFYESGVGAGIPRYDYSVLPKGQGDNIGDFFVRIDLKAGGRFQKTSQFVEYLQGELDRQVPSGRIIVDELGIMAMITQPMEVKVFSSDLNDLNAAADQIAQAMREMEGVVCVNNSSDLSVYGYYVDMDSKELNSLGLMKAEVQNELSIALMGRSVSLYRENEKEYDVVLESKIDSLTALQNYKVKSSASGEKYVLQQFADVTLQPQLTTITRINGERGRAVGCTVTSASSSILMQAQLERQLNQMEFPDSVRLEYTGDKKDFLDVGQNIARAFVFSFAVIFLLLLLQFNQIKKALMVFISLPFGAMAGIAGLFITGQKLTMFAMLSILALMGCVLANAIVLIGYIDEERARGIPVEEACKAAGARRFRPILMSTITTVLGLFPLAIGGDTLFIPMAILLMFGLTISMLVNLIVVPLVYNMVYGKSEKREEMQLCTK